MVNVKKIDNDNEHVEINGTKINVEDYNAWSEEGSKNRVNFRRRTHIAEHLNTWKRYNKLWEECMGSMKDKNGKYLPSNEQSDEIKKNRFVNRNLWQKINDAINEDTYEVDEGENKKVLENGERKTTKLTGIDLSIDNDNNKLKERVEKNDAWWENHLPWYKKMISLMEELVANKVETGNERGKPLNDFHDSDRTKEGEKQTELAQYKDKIYQEITNLMNQDPKITDADLEGEDSKLIHHAISKEGVDRIKSKLVAAIEKARNAKKGKRKRENEEENDNSNKRPKLESEEEENYENTKNKTVNELGDEELKKNLAVLIRMEGDEEYNNQQRRKELEKELWKRNRSLYLETVMEALKRRMTDAEVELDKLSEKAKRVVEETNNIIAEAREFREFEAVKEEAIQEIGKVGAESKWTSWINKGKALLEKVKKGATEKLKKDIKTVQQQFASLKSGTNTYSKSYYQQNENKIKKLENDLLAYSNSSQTGSPNKTPWGVIIPVSLVAVLIVASAAVVIVRRKRKLEKIKK